MEGTSRVFPKKWKKDDQEKRITTTIKPNDMVKLGLVKVANKSFALMVRSREKLLNSLGALDEKE